MSLKDWLTDEESMKNVSSMIFTYFVLALGHWLPDWNHVIGVIIVMTVINYIGYRFKWRLLSIGIDTEKL